jgi:hypothetical protein
VLMAFLFSIYSTYDMQMLAFILSLTDTGLEGLVNEIFCAAFCTLVEMA